MVAGRMDTYLQGVNGGYLESQVRLVLRGDRAYQSLEWQLADEQLS